MNVFSYWEGPKPEYIDVCIKSMARVIGQAFHLVTPANIDEWLPDNMLHPAYKTLPQPALRADAIRAALLATHGGWWWDADTIALHSPDWLLRRYPDAEAIYGIWDRNPIRVFNGYIWIRPGSEISSQWLQHVNDALAANPNDVSWCSLGEKLLTRLVGDHPYAVRVERVTFLPIDIDSEVQRFFLDERYYDLEWTKAVCVGLNHSWFMFHRGRDMTLPMAEWKHSPLLIHKLLKDAVALNERYGHA